MSTEIQDYIVNTNTQDWQPLVEKGIRYEGVFVKSLRFDQKQQRSPTIMLKFEPGASYPYHNHPGGEELFILTGEATIGGAVLKTGDYLYTPVNFKHAVSSEKGCIIFFMIPEEVEIL